MSRGSDFIPAGVLWYKEDVVLNISVSVIFKPVALGNKLVIPLFKGA